MSKEMKTLAINGNTYEIVDEKARNAIPVKISQLENDSQFITNEDVSEQLGDLEGKTVQEYVEASLAGFEGGSGSNENVDLSNYYTKEEIDEKGFITKADIPTDESYELIGQTPLTLNEKSNVKLESAVETTYEAKTPTVWNFDDFFASGNYTLTKCTLEKENDHYKITSGDTVTAHYQSYVKVLIPVEAGKTYNLCWDNSASKKEPYESATDWGGSGILYDGTDTSKIIKSGIHFDEVTSYIFTPTTDTLQIRYYPASSSGKSPKANVIGRFNYLWLNEGEATSRTEPYNASGTFNGSVLLQKVPKGTTVTTTSTANVYVKASTDKTLTKSDVPADAEVTGKEIEAVKNLLPLYGKTIVNFGDSIFGNARPPKDVSTFLAEKTGAEVLNCAFGGCRMAIRTDLGHWNDFTMVRLAEAISSNDYSVQDEALNYDDRVSYAEEPLTLIKATDFSTVDIITIAYGTNDFTSNIPLDNEEDSYDEETLAGALRTSIESLLTAYPNLRIFILSTTWRFWVDGSNVYTDDSNTRTNSNGLKLADYNAKLKEVAEEYNLPFVDDYNIGIGKYNRSYYFNDTDGTHHKETGRKLIATHLAKELY